VSDQSQIPAVLTVGKEPSVPVEKEAACAPEPFWTDILHFWRVHIGSVALWNCCLQLVLASFPRIKAKNSRSLPANASYCRR